VQQLYTRKGDDGTTGLLYGGRVRKDAPIIEANGAVDEAQAFLGLVRAEAEHDSELDRMLVAIERDLWVLMAELATAPENRAKLTPGQSLVTAGMVSRLESEVDALGGRYEMPREFVIPGQNRVAALLDVARTVVRRAERLALSAQVEGAHVVAYLNRLSTLLWVMARWQEDGEALLSRSVLPSPQGGSR
jgi:cob(I)alamin adenosyltransferase